MNYISKVIACVEIAVLGLVVLCAAFLPTVPVQAVTCTKTIYVHYTSFGFSNNSILYNNKNPCWGLEVPQYSGGAKWSVCNTGQAAPSGGTRWAYNEIKIGTHSDQTYITNCKNANGGAADTAYVVPDSGGTNLWSHSGITGVNHYFNECYTSAGVHDRSAGCTNNGGSPMWNLQKAAADGTVGTSVRSLCDSTSGGHWIGFYSAGLSDLQMTNFVNAMNACTTS
jgi:hypothetical protein